ncbi:MAG: hypothetical protein EA355_13620 [Rhodobacteraceae bacterium]|nr:MAG: hypothetical protein EA355_13620 [Paracoccaceae bacterium]
METPRGFLALLAAAAAVMAAGCDDGTVVTRVDRRPAFSESWIVATAAGGVPTEIHGRPFPGVSPDEIANRLRMPQRFAADIRFRARAPGPRGLDPERRLVLVFNATEGPNGIRDCRRTEEAPTRPPADEGFTVTATFCTEDRMLATGHLAARRTRADDPEAFTRVMRLLLTQITARN